MVERKVLKRKTIDTDLQIGVMFHGLGDNKVSITLTDYDDNTVDIGWHEVETDEDDEGDAFLVDGPCEVNKAIDDAVDNLNLMIARLNKLKKLPDNSRDPSINKANSLRTFTIGTTTKAKKK